MSSGLYYPGQLLVSPSSVLITTAVNESETDRPDTDLLTSLSVLASPRQTSA
jgi:hypothetical protein